MNLVVDIGNTRIKAGRFAGKDLLVVKAYDTLDPKVIEAEIGKGCTHMIASTTGATPDLAEFGQIRGEKLILDHNTSLPIVNTYTTPATLGKDRLAGVVGGYIHCTPDCEAVMVVDMGTCMTLDVVTCAGRYDGGNISPGVQMRLRAMHEYTENLPLESLVPVGSELGDSTSAAIVKGVVHGIRLEIDGYRSELAGRYGRLKTILTGGDAAYFADRLKTGIFVRPNLVLEGLNEILNLHVEDREGTPGTGG